MLDLQVALSICPAEPCGPAVGSGLGPGRHILAALACTGGDVPVRQRAVMVTACPAGTSCWPFSLEPIRSMTLPAQQTG
jgi:hypothetical protein